MKVLFIHCTYRYKGGEDTVVAEELNLLRANGAETELLEFNNDDSALLNVLQMSYNASSYHKTLAALRSFKPDVVHVHNLHFAASPSVLKAVKKEKIPLVMTLHNFRLLCPSAILYHNGKSFLSSVNSSFPLKAALQGVYKNSVPLTFWMSLSMQIHQWLKVWNLPDRYIALNEHARQLFINSKLHFAPGKIVVKPNFCYAPPLPSSQPSAYFLYVGRLTEEKGVRMMLQAFATAGFTLKMAGDGPLRDEVIDFCAKHPNIEYLSSLKKEDVFHLLRTCTALIFPSIWYEGMPLTIIEAFASGAPVIASKLGAMETMIADHYNGLHFEAGNENSLLQKLQEWQTLTTEEQAVYRHQARYTYEQHYTPERNAEQLFAIYNSVLPQHKRQYEENAVPPAKTHL